MSEPTKKETKEIIRSLCVWLETAHALLPHAPPYNPDTLHFVKRLHETISYARALADDLIEEEPWCPGDKLGGVCPGIESGVNSDCPKWKEEE